MPQIQVLPAVPQISPAIAAGIAQAGGSLAQAFQKRVEQQKAQQWMNIIQDPNSTATQQVSAFMNLPPDIKKSAAPALAPILGAKAETEEMTKRREAYHKRYGAEPQPGGIYGQAPAMPMSGAPGQVPPQGQQMQGMGGQQQPTPEQIAFLEASPDPEEKAMGQALRKNLEVQQGIEKENRAVLNKPAEKYLEQMAKYRESAPQAIEASDLMIDAILNDDVGYMSGPHFKEIAESFGVPSSILKKLETPGSKEFKSGRKELMGKIIRDSFRGTTSMREISLAEEMIAELGVEKDANLASALGTKIGWELKQIEADLSQKYADEGIQASKISSMTSKAMKEIRKQKWDDYYDFLKYLRAKEMRK